MPTDSNTQSWYIVKGTDEHCTIVPERPELPEGQPVTATWGPFDSADRAIAQRVGLIRAGKCQPVVPH
jgi:hypothetical protein